MNSHHTTPSPQREPGWKTGAARRIITPEEPMWMAGFGFRDRPAEGTQQDLWVKALALEDPAGRQALVLSAEICGFPRTFGDRIASELKQRHGIPREAVMLTVTHTHSGPVVEDYLPAMSGRIHMTDEHRAQEKAYTKTLERKVLEAAEEAVKDLSPSALSWGTGKAEFGVNRRENPQDSVEERRREGALEGPVDPDVPVLIANAPDGRITAIVFAYACHATALSGYEWTGDWPGHTQRELEARYPGAAALFIPGCGGDIGALPRRKLELAKKYGSELARAVQEVIEAGTQPVRGHLDPRFGSVELPFEAFPGKHDLKEELSSDTPARRIRAERLLAELNKNDKLSSTYPYAIQVWKFGTELTWISLAGEVVVDYALRLKEELDPKGTWVTAYAHDILGYIPSRRVLEEGGYEGDTSHVFYGLPSPWQENVEELIIDKTHRLLKTGRHRPNSQQ